MGGGEFYRILKKSQKFKLLRNCKWTLNINFYLKNFLLSSKSKLCPILLFQLRSVFQEKSFLSIEIIDPLSTFLHFKKHIFSTPCPPPPGLCFPTGYTSHAAVTEEQKQTKPWLEIEGKERWGDCKKEEGVRTVELFGIRHHDRIRKEGSKMKNYDEAKKERKLLAELRNARARIDGKYIWK